MPPESSLIELAQCGEIREITLQDLDSSGVVATVEFVERVCPGLLGRKSRRSPSLRGAAQESVLPALTKDKKRIDGHEVEVYLAWQSTLYVTNFPPSMDDAAMRKLFSEVGTASCCDGSRDLTRRLPQYGTILDVRWPSKRFKATRRFCYVQYVLPVRPARRSVMKLLRTLVVQKFAQAALDLDGREMEAGVKMHVLVSDPERRKERTDARTNLRELYITGLSRFAKESDLQRLFSRVRSRLAVGGPGPLTSRTVRRDQGDQDDHRRRRPLKRLRLCRIRDRGAALLGEFEPELMLYDDARSRLRRPCRSTIRS